MANIINWVNSNFNRVNLVMPSTHSGDKLVILISESVMSEVNMVKVAIIIMASDKALVIENVRSKTLGENCFMVN